MKFLNENQAYKLNKFLEIKEHEVEVRFGYYNEYGFVSSVSLLSFNNLKHFCEDKNFKKIKEQFKQQKSKSYRATIDEKGNKIYEKKIKNDLIDVDEWGFRIARSEEKIITVLNEEPIRFERQLNRIKFFVEDKKSDWYGVDIDMSIVIEGLKNKYQKYEIELERTQDITAEHYMNIVENVMKVMQDNSYIMSMYELNNIKREWNEIIPASLNSHKKDFFNEFVSRPRDITFEDIYCKYFFSRDNRLTENCSVFVAPKLDGLRKFLFFNKRKIFHICHPLEIKYIGDICGYVNEHTAIYDTELIENRYHIFDILYFNDSSTLNFPFEKRHELMTHVSKKIFNNMNIVIGDNSIMFVKKNTYMKCEDNFQNTCKKMFEFIEQKNIKNDGLIIRPNWEPYTNQPPLGLKWKDSGDMTIDFYVSCNAQGSATLHYFDFNELKKFSGTDENPYNEEVFFEDGKFNNEYVDGSIIEFIYKKNNANKWIFFPVRIRREKSRPNGKITVFNIWALLKNPLEKEALYGDNTRVSEYISNREFLRIGVESKYDLIIDCSLKDINWNVVKNAMKNKHIVLYSQKITKFQNFIIINNFDKIDRPKKWLFMCNKIPSTINEHVIIFMKTQKNVFDDTSIPFISPLFDEIETEEIETSIYENVLNEANIFRLKNVSYKKMALNTTLYKSIQSVEYKEPWTYPFYANVWQIHQPGSGSCFYHSVLYALYEEYRNSDDKMGLVIKFRAKTATEIRKKGEEYIDKETLEHIIETFKLDVFQTLSFQIRQIPIQKIMQNIDDKNDIKKKLQNAPQRDFYRILFMQSSVEDLYTIMGLKKADVDIKNNALSSLYNKIENPRVFVDEIMLRLIEKYLEINIFVVDRETRKVMHRKNVFNKLCPSIVLLIVKDIHYDLLSVYDQFTDKLKTWFENEHPLIQQLLKNIS